MNAKRRRQTLREEDKPQEMKINAKRRRQTPRGEDKRQEEKINLKRRRQTPKARGEDNRKEYATTKRINVDWKSKRPVMEGKDKT